MLVELTSRGHQAAERAVRLLLTREQSLVDVLLAVEQAQLAGLLAELLRHLASRR